MSDRTNNLSRSVEDYLKAIYSLTERGEWASTNDIASALEVQPASVSGMVKRLAEAGFLDHTPYRGVQLTHGGKREALRVIRRHRVLETYLTNKLGYSWEDVHREAERLEHAASDMLVERMAAELENPRHDPHGSPIPTSSGEIDTTEYESLAEAAPGEVVEIRAVEDHDADRLRYMEARGLTPGTQLTVEDQAPFRGPVTVRLTGTDGESQVVGYDLARRIFVSAAE